MKHHFVEQHIMHDEAGKPFLVPFWRVMRYVAFTPGPATPVVEFITNPYMAEILANKLNLRDHVTGEPVVSNVARELRSWSTPEALKVSRSILECQS